MNKQHYYAGVLIFRVSEDRVDTLAGSECNLVRDQAGGDVVFDVTKNQNLKAPFQDGDECHGAFRPHAAHLWIIADVSKH